jgi:hypothetical protein
VTAKVKVKIYKQFRELKLAESQKANIIFDKSEIVLKENLDYTVVFHRLVKVNKEKAIDHLINPEVSYSTSKEVLDILLARTIKPDGTVYEVDVKSIVRSAKFQKYPAFDDLTVIKFSYPNLKKGDLIEIKYRVKASNSYMGGFFDYARVLAGYYPAGLKEIKITYPKSVKLKHKLLSRDVEVKYSKVLDDSTITETFSTYGTKGYDYESGMPKYADVAPHVVFSTYDNWKSIGAWYKKIVDGSYDLNDTMKKFLADVQIQAMGDKLVMAQMLYRFVTKNVKYVGLWLGESNIKERSAKDVFDKLYGDSKDKTTLYVALLRGVGIEARPVLVSSRGMPTYTRDFPAMIFNHVITNFELNGKSYLVDPTTSSGVFNYLPESLQGRYSLIIDDSSELAKIPASDKYKNGSEYFFELDLDDSGSLQGKLKIIFRGESGSSLRYALTDANEKEANIRIQKVLISLIPGIKIKSMSFKGIDSELDPAEIEVNFSTDKYFDKVDDLLIVPAKLISFKRPDMVVSKTRVFSIEFWSLWTNSVNFKYKFPANYKVRNIPKNKNIRNSFFDYKLKVGKIKENSIGIYEQFKTKKLEIKPNEYLGFKRDYDRLLQLEEKFIVLQKEQ